MGRRFVLGVMLGIALLAAACSDDGESAATPATATTNTTSTTESAPPTTTTSTTPPAPTTTARQGPVVVPDTFEAGIMPIVTATCAQCHTGDGPGTQHVRFDTAADVAANSGDVALVTAAGVMPPWPASSLSVSFQHDWRLTAEEVAAITAWHEGGAELDVAPATELVPTDDIVSLSDVDLEILPEVGFDGDASTGDEYRCLVYDPQLTEPAWLLGFEFVPDQEAVVHHAIGYRMPGDLRERAAERDAAAGDGGGWTCFGGSGLAVNEIFLGWAPGQGATTFPAGSGLRMEPGEFLVIQIHYHFDVDAPEDFSYIRLDFAEDDGELDEVFLEVLLAPAEIPCTDAEQGPLCDRTAALTARVADYGITGAPADFILALCGFSPADYADMTDGIASASCDTQIGYRAQVISVLGHEHELGRSFRMTLNPDTPEELVLLDIPKWDFEWQFNYYPVDEIVIEPDDEIRIECSWDRSLRDPDLEPAYVLWADGTDDEMCFATVVVRAED